MIVSQSRPANNDASADAGADDGAEKNPDGQAAPGHQIVGRFPDPRHHEERHPGREDDIEDQPDNNGEMSSHSTLNGWSGQLGEIRFDDLFHCGFNCLAIKGVIRHYAPAKIKLETVGNDGLGA